MSIARPTVDLKHDRKLDSLTNLGSERQFEDHFEDRINLLLKRAQKIDYQRCLQDFIAMKHSLDRPDLLFGRLIFYTVVLVFQ